MTKADLLQRLRATFLIELEETVGDLCGALTQLEAQAGSEKQAQLHASLFRGAHSLKGAARTVEYFEVADLMHAIEDLLRARVEGPALDADLRTLILACLDALHDAGRRARQGEPLTVPSAPELTRALVAAGAGRPFVQPTPAPLPPLQSSPSPGASAPLGPASEVGRARVEVERLDSLLSKSAELLVERGRVRADVQRLNEVGESLANWQRGFRSFAGKARTVLGPGPDHDPALTELLQQLDRAMPLLKPLIRELEGACGALGRDVARLERVAEPLDAQIRRVRMVPFSELLPRLQRTVREAASFVGRQVRLQIEGGEVEADRAIIEGLASPLLHLVRNAVCHGIEPAGLRAAMGKPSDGLLRIVVGLRAGALEVRVEDDGAGVDVEEVREALKRRGLPVPATSVGVLRSLFSPQMSTRAKVDALSGRGVGLDVVRDSVEALHGSVELFSTVGQGTQVVLCLPLTVTRLRALCMQAGGEVLCLASAHVLRLLRVDPEAVRKVNGADVLDLDGQTVPVVELAQALGLPPARPIEGQGKLHVMVVTEGGRVAAFVVDGFLSEGERVIKSLGPRLVGLALFGGATLMASGQVALVLQPAPVVDVAVSGAASHDLGARVRPAAAPRRARILVADDSRTTRSMVTSVLEAAGHEVVSTEDGSAGWRCLQEQSFDLVVADVEMPLMDGLHLTRTIRSSPQHRGLPVVLISGLDTREDRRRGLEAGADTYLVKTSFDQTRLLEAVERLL